MHKHGRANGVLERVFTYYLLPLQMPWGPQQPILPQVPVVGHAGLGPKDDYHFMQVAGAKSLDLHKALAGDRAPYHNFLQASRHLQSMCLIPDGDPANGICMGNLIEVVQRSAVSIYDNNTRSKAYINTERKRHRVTLATFKDMDLFIASSQLHDQEFLQQRLRQVLLSVQAQSTLTKLMIQMKCMRTALFTRVLHFIGGQHIGPFAPGMLVSAESGSSDVKAWAEALCQRSEAHKALFHRAQRVGLSLQDLMTAIHTARLRAGMDGFVLPSAFKPAGLPSTQEARPGLMLFRIDLFGKGITPPEGLKSGWPALKKVQKMRLKGDAKLRAEEDALQSWVDHVEAMHLGRGFREAVQLALNAGVKLTTVHWHWVCWGRGELFADNWPPHEMEV